MDMVIFSFMKLILFQMHYCMDYMELYILALIHTLHIMVHVCCSALHIQVYR